MKAFLLGILVGVVLVAIVGFVVALGFNMEATNPPGPLERLVAHELVDRTLERHAPKDKNPRPASPEVLAEGLAHYRENCLVCHGAPGVELSEIGKGLNPAAPNLAHRGTQHESDGELYWTIREGIRMTGMPAFGPTHSSDEIWTLVTFVRHLPQLTEAEIKALKQEAREEEEHHHEHEAPPAESPAHAPGTEAPARH